MRCSKWGGDPKVSPSLVHRQSLLPFVLDTTSTDLHPQHDQVVTETVGSEYSERLECWGCLKYQPEQWFLRSTKSLPCPSGKVRKRRATRVQPVRFDDQKRNSPIYDTK